MGLALAARERKEGGGRCAVARVAKNKKNLRAGEARVAGNGPPSLPLVALISSFFYHLTIRNLRRGRSELKLILKPNENIKGRRGVHKCAHRWCVYLLFHH